MAFGFNPFSQNQSGGSAVAGGLFGLGDVATGGLFTAGSSLLGGLGGLLRGRSKAQKRGDEIFKLLRGELGKDVLNPEQDIASFQRATRPGRERQAEIINRRLGLDSGAAQGELARGMQSQLAQFLLSSRRQNALAKSQRDTSLLGLLSQFGER